jgi:hypothetical protein
VIRIATALKRTTAKYGNRGRGYVYMEAGHVAESLMLQAVALSRPRWLESSAMPK